MLNTGIDNHFIEMYKFYSGEVFFFNMNVDLCQVRFEDNALLWEGNTIGK